jgi:hypothetical protein
MPQVGEKAVNTTALSPVGHAVHADFSWLSGTLSRNGMHTMSNELAQSSKAFSQLTI